MKIHNQVWNCELYTLTPISNLRWINIQTLGQYKKARRRKKSHSQIFLDFFRKILCIYLSHDFFKTSEQIIIGIFLNSCVWH